VLRSQYIFIFSFLLFISCKKDKKTSQPSEQAVPHVYSSSTYLSNLPPMFGGCIDKYGYLTTFHIPLLQSSAFGANALISARILKLKAQGNDSIIVNFTNAWFNSNMFFNTTVNNINGWLPGAIRASLAYTKNTELFVAYNKSYNNTIYHVTNGQCSPYIYINALTAMCSFGNSLYAMSTPMYNSGNSLTQQASIYQIDSTGALSTYFTFPPNITFKNNCGTTSSGSFFLPIDILIDIKMGTDSSLYVAAGYDNVIYKIDKNKILTKHIETIFCPISIDIDDKQRLFVASAPGFTTTTNQSNYSMYKPMQVHEVVNSTNNRLIYEGALSNWSGNGCLINTLDDKWVAGDCNANISINKKGQIFLEDPLERKIFLIE
jgi:hypothetical protein